LWEYLLNEPTSVTMQFLLHHYLLLAKKAARKFFFSTLFLTPLFLSAQPNIKWDKTFGIPGAYSQISVSRQTKDGGYILGGLSNGNSEGDKSEPSNGKVDFWIVKIAADGTKEWDRSIGGTGMDNLQTLQLTSDGGYILAGVSDSGIGGDKTEATRGRSDYWIVKLSEDGSKEWDRTYGSADDDSPSSIQQTSDGGYIVGGQSGAILSGDKTEGSKGSTDCWILKLTAEGDKVWDKTIGGPDYDALAGILELPDGSFAIGASSNSGIGADKSEESRGGEDYWLVKIDQNGVKQWDRTFGGYYFDWMNSIQLTADGGFLLGGSSSSTASGEKTEPSPGNNGNDDYWLVKVGADGTKQWDKTIGGFGVDHLASVQQTADGGYILGGMSQSTRSRDKTEYGRGFYDYWIVKLASDRTKQWDKTIGGAGDDYLTSVLQADDGSYLLAGSSASAAGGEKTGGVKGERDIWIVKMAAERDSLQVTLSAFTAQINGSTASLNWSTTFETSFEHFEVEHSVNRLAWATLGTIKGKGESNALFNYDFTDTNPVIGEENLYRLKMIGTDGKFAYSGVVSLVFVGKAPIIQWDKTLGGNMVDFLNSIIQTTDGGYLMGGSSASGISGTKTENSRGDYDYWIVKISKDGTKEWEKTIGGSGDDRLTSMQQTSDGGYILGGFSKSYISGEKTEDNKSVVSVGWLPSDYWVVKLSANGSKEWDKTIGGDRDDILQSVRQTTDGGYILGGSSSSNAGGDKTVGPLGNVSYYLIDYWVVKLNVNGVKEWDRTLGAANEEYLTSLEPTADGGYIILGSYGDGYDCWLVKLSSVGATEWGKTFLGGTLAYVQQTTDLGYILGGTSTNNAGGSKTENSKGRTDYWVMKVSASGIKEWDKTMGGRSGDGDTYAGDDFGYDVLTSIQQTKDGGYIVGGTSDSGADNYKTDASSGPDYWVVKLRANGTKEWDKTIGGGRRWDQLMSARQTSDGGYILGGYTDSGLDGDKTEPSLGSNDYWVVKLSPTDGALPVALSSFAVRKENNTAILDWSTTSETKSDRFEVQHSTNGRSWTLLATVGARGESANDAYYQHIHGNPSAGSENLYRLKMIDLDGTYTFSTIRSIHFEGDAVVTIYPNPVSETLIIDAKQWQLVVGVQLINSSGMTVYSSGKNPVRTFDVSKLPLGLYFVKVMKVDGSSILQKVMVVR
jgi:hypothetical protein